MKGVTEAARGLEKVEEATKTNRVGSGSISQSGNGRIRSPNEARGMAYCGRGALSTLPALVCPNVIGWATELDRAGGRASQSSSSAGTGAHR